MFSQNPKLRIYTELLFLNIIRCITEFKEIILKYFHFFRIDKTQLVRKFDERYSPDK